METKNDNIKKEVSWVKKSILFNNVEFNIFEKKCGKPYQMMLREMVDAFNDDRLKIIPTDEQKQSLEIYKE